jgi:hypothetical protein
MAKRNSSSNQLPIFEAKVVDSQLVGIKRPPSITFSKDTYSTLYHGKTFWTGELVEGDLVVIDPERTPVAGDYVVIWVKGESEPFIEKLALSFLRDTIGKEIHPGSNAIPSLSIALPDGFMRMAPCSKLEKVHSIIGKVPSLSEVAA